MNKTVVLVVEDDRPIRNLIVTTLKMHDYKYLTANNGVSAIMEASSHHPDIVLLDLGLPDMEGVDVIKKIRTWSNMPIIVISARSEDSDKIEALDSGADDYITKPFSVEELLARIRVTQRRLAIIQAGEEQEASIFINGQLKIDYTAGCTYLKGKELHLTPLAMQHVSAVGISESPVNIECRVRKSEELGSHTMFIADVVGVTVDDKYMDGTGKFHINDTGLVMYSHGEYFGFGDKLGSFGYSVRKTKK